MSVDTLTLGHMTTVDMLKSGQPLALDDLHDLEASMSMIRESREQVTEYKALKKKRNVVIDGAITKLESRIDFLESIILQTLKAKKEKNVKFPGIGLVSTRDVKGKWIVNDEAQLFKFLADENELNKVTKTHTEVKKKELNKLLDVYEATNKAPGCVERTASELGLAFTFDKEEEEVDLNISVPNKPIVDVSNAKF